VVVAAAWGERNEEVPRKKGEEKQSPAAAPI